MKSRMSARENSRSSRTRVPPAPLHVKPVAAGSRESFSWQPHPRPAGPDCYATLRDSTPAADPGIVGSAPVRSRYAEPFEVRSSRTASSKGVPRTGARVIPPNGLRCTWKHPTAGVRGRINQAARRCRSNRDRSAIVAPGFHVEHPAQATKPPELATRRRAGTGAQTRCPCLVGPRRCPTHEQHASGQGRSHDASHVTPRRDSRETAEPDTRHGADWLFHVKRPLPGTLGHCGRHVRPARPGHAPPVPHPGSIPRSRPALKECRGGATSTRVPASSIGEPLPWRPSGPRMTRAPTSARMPTGIGRRSIRRDPQQHSAPGRYEDLLAQRLEASPTVVVRKRSQKRRERYRGLSEQATCRAELNLLQGHLDPCRKALRELSASRRSPSRETGHDSRPPQVGRGRPPSDFTLRRVGWQRISAPNRRFTNCCTNTRADLPVHHRCSQSSATPGVDSAPASTAVVRTDTGQSVTQLALVH